MGALKSFLRVYHIPFTQKLDDTGRLARCHRSAKAYGNCTRLKDFLNRCTLLDSPIGLGKHAWLASLDQSPDKSH